MLENDASECEHDRMRIARRAWTHPSRQKVGRRRPPLHAIATLLLVATASPPSASAENEPRSHALAVWTGVMTDVEIRRPWFLWLDAHYNTQAFVVLRPGLTYRFESGAALTAGYAHLWTNAGEDNFARNEHRLFGQAFFPFSFDDRWRFSQRLRLEYRLRQNLKDGRIVDGWNGIVRYRAQTVGSYWVPTKQKTRFLLQVALELLANSGQNAGPNFLDQSRLAFMFGFKHQPVTWRLGYMDRFVPGTSGAAPVHEHNIVLWLNYALRREPTLRREHPTPEEGNP